MNVLPSNNLTKANEEIAIVGIGCALPGGVNSPAELWKFLSEGRDGIVEVPANRWNLDAVYDPQPATPGKLVSRRAAFLNDVMSFDAGFFGISPREAAVIDPQQRLLLEVTWRALEDAGISAESLAGSKTGVYIGISHSDYHAIQQFGRRQIDVHTSTGGALSIAANRISHRFDLRGPSLAVDTACSSSLVALDIARTALLTGECDLAFVGGVNVMLTPDVSITFSRAAMLAPDGRCKAFDQAANGYVRGEGAGIVVLKPLSRALLDRDRIHAVLCATAINQDGHTSTITVPSMDAQIAMLRNVCSVANVDPSQIGYVEAHGTGTPIGDPIEANAIGRVFGGGRTPDRPCLMGSIKTNIGHLEPAAGVVGLIKAALCVREGEIPPSLNFKNPNSHIDFNKLGIKVQSELTAWPDMPGSRIAAVNSFGFGGTNACAIVREPPVRLENLPRARGAVNWWPTMLPVSAASKKTLATLCGRFAEEIDLQPGALNDIVGTAALRRSHLDYRGVAMGSSAADLAAALRELAAGKSPANVVTGRRCADRRLVFAFTGQGSQWWAMGRGLFQTDPVFRDFVKRCGQLFYEKAGWSLLDQFQASEHRSRMNETSVAQPATFAVQAGLAERLQAWGIHPDLVIGHSIGEVAAAYVAGALSLPDAVELVYHRSRLQEQSRFQGGMAAVGLSAHEASTALEKFDGRLEIAAVNGPELTTIAGPRMLLEEFVEHIKRERKDVLCQPLRVDYAFHSYQMDAFTEELRGSLAGLKPQRAQIPMISTVTGDLVRGNDLDAGYWCRNMRDTVLFKPAIDKAIEKGFQIFLELGAHPSLLTPIRACLAARSSDGVAIGTLQRERKDVETISAALANLHVHGAKIDWHTVVSPKWNLIDLFGYPWDRQVHWQESEESKAARFEAPVHPLLGYRLRTVQPIWQSEIDASSPAYLLDHKIEGSVVFPAAGYVETILAATREIFGEMPHELEQIAFHEALALSRDVPTLLETSFDEARGIVMVRSRHRGPNTSWILRATARVRRWPVPELPIEQWNPEVEPPTQVGRARFYRDLEQEGHSFGRCFQGVETLWYAEGYSLGKITLSEAITDAARYIMHPTQLDSCFQTIRGFRGFGTNARSGGTMAIPLSINQIRLFRPATGTLFARARVQTYSAAEIIAHISIINDAGQVVAIIDGFRCLRMEKASKRRENIAASFYREEWVPLPPIAGPAMEASGCDGTWLILADRGNVGSTLARLIAAKGGTPVLAVHDHLPSEPGLAVRRLDTSKASYRRLIKEIGSPKHIVDLRILDDDVARVNLAALSKARLTNIENLWRLTRSLAGLAAKPRLWVVTAGAVQVTEQQPISAATVLNAGCIGFLRSLHNEHPEFRPTLVDFGSGEILPEQLLAEINRGSDETEVALRGEHRFGSRFEQLPQESLQARMLKWDVAKRTSAFRVTMKAAGLLENLYITSIEQPEPKPDEVIVEVRAVGLNFRDIMAATNLLPAGAEERPAWQNLGLECAGVVSAVGEDVDRDLIGQRVVAVTAGCLASHIAVASDRVFPIPRKLSFASAAAIPIAFATAHHALVTLGRMSAGDKVLIHAAAGGVGLAAVALAKFRGAEILATAGTHDKRLYLHKLGVEHVFDSRSVGFADGVMWKTEDRGVDIVLNSLPGPFIEKGMSVLAPGGRFLEIGKRDVYADTPISLYAMRNNVAFHAIDLAKLGTENPKVLRAEIKSVIRALTRGDLDPVPVTTFPVSKVAEAFRFMAAAKHIGKVVISLDDKNLMVPERGTGALPVLGNASYLVTGGTKGLGLETARWLAANGAGCVVLAARSRPADGGFIEELRRTGCRVELVHADVSERGGARAAVLAARRAGMPLRGVIHAAGQIEDALIAKLNARHIKNVFAGKVLGAWNLHEETKSLPLDFFVLYSSIATALGSVGQAHYAAANRYLDAIAAHRRAISLPASSIAFGPIGDVGYLATRPEVAKNIDAAGTQLISSATAMGALETMLRRAPANVAFAKVNWSKLGQALSLIASSPRVAGLAQASLGNQGGPDSRLRATLLEMPEEQRPEAITNYLRRKVAGVLKIEPKAVEIERPLSEIGLDSLTAFELKNRIENELGVGLPIGKFLQRPTIAAIVPIVIETINNEVKSSADQADGADLNFNMSIGQEALWYIDRLDPGNPAYGLAACISVRPHFDDKYIDQVIQRIVARHDNLRMAFPSDGVGPVPTLLPVERCQLTRHDAVELSEEQFAARLGEEVSRPFDIEEGPLGRLHLFRRADRDVFLLHYHHIVADAMSIAVLMDEVFENYMALRSNLPPPPPPRRAPYGQFALWQRAMAAGPEGQSHSAFWKAELGDAPPPLLLNTDRPRKGAVLGPGAAHRFVLKSTLVGPLKELAKSRGTTVFAVLFSAFNAMLHLYSGETDIVVGAPVSGRTRAEFERTVGYLVNALPIRTRLARDASFEQLLAEASTRLGAALEHQDYPFALIVRDLDPPRQPGCFPFFNIMFGMERFEATDPRGHAATLLNMSGPAVKFGEFVGESIMLPRHRAPFDMTFTMEEFGDQILGLVDYRSDLWEKSTISLFVDHYQSILHQLVAKPSQKICDFLLEGRAALISGPKLQERPDVIASIRSAALRYPDAIALSDVRASMTYREMIARVDAAAVALIERRLGPDCVIGVCLPRGLDLPIALLAVLAAGSAYVPLDPDYPSERIATLIGLTKPKAIIATGDMAGRVPENAVHVDINALAQPNRHKTLPASAPTALAYIIHTSGSTGSPSGVEIERGALANFLAAMRSELPLSANDVFLAVTTAAFDIAGLELFLPLTVGATVVIAESDAVRDGNRLRELVAKSNATMMQGTPSTWQMLFDAGWSGISTLTALCGGEALPPSLAAKLIAGSRALFNLYGPTETTIWSTISKVTDSSKAVSIGRPIANTYCYVADADLRPVCQGATGELLIGGLGLARGYRNDRKRTVERFIVDPTDPRGIRRMFRTGDYVAIAADGSINFHGRRDQQVKIRGFRIELGEVEAVLRDHRTVSDAAVLAIGEDLVDRRLCAVVVANGPETAEKIRLYLGNRLPRHMVPDDIRLIDAIPRLANGKVDRAKLSREVRQPPGPRREPVAPRTPVEIRLASILKELLGHDKFGIEDDFFALGGTSLLGLRFVARINDVFAVGIGPAELMCAPTVAAMAQLIFARLSGGGLSGPSAGEWDETAPQIDTEPNRRFWRPLSVLRAEGAFDTISAAAIGYLPDDLLFAARALNLEATIRRQLPAMDDPQWGALCRLRLGNVGLILIPRFGGDLIADPDSARKGIDAAVDFATRLGAKAVALTGILPTVTDLGRALPARENLAITTGHGATASAVVATAFAIAKASRRKLRSEDVAIVGLGAIGTASLRLLLNLSDHPRSLTLCDVPAKRAELEAFAAELRSVHGFFGRISIVHSNPVAPGELYRNRFIIGAASVRGVIDVSRLEPGTILVDDSFPHCFDPEDAIRRMQSQGDVLLVDGGLIAPPGGTNWTITLPNSLAALVARDRNVDLLPMTGEITACIFSALMVERQLVPPMVGPAAVEECRSNWQALEELGATAAGFRCGRWGLEDELVSRVSGRPIHAEEEIDVLQ